MYQEFNICKLLEDEKTPADRITRHLELLALGGTAFISERTLMAWMRTSVSLITFGFSITKFFEYLEQQQQGAQSVDGPYQLGIALILLGTLTLVPAVVENLHRLGKMKELGLPVKSRLSIPLVATVALFGIGVVVLINILLTNRSFAMHFHKKIRNWNKLRKAARNQPKIYIFPDQSQNHLPRYQSNADTCLVHHQSSHHDAPSTSETSSR